MTGFANPEYLVETEWLAEHLDDPGITIVDVTSMLTSKFVNRAKAEVFDLGHLPGAVFLDAGAGHGDLADADDGLPWMWPSPEAFAATMGRLGIANDSRVIITAGTPRPEHDSGTMWCTRAWWTMHHMGVDCAILRGGIEKWRQEGRPLVTESSVPSASVFTVADGRSKGRATKDDVKAAIDAGSACVVDALSEADFAGQGTAYGPRKGHIQGAVNLPGHALIDAQTALFPDATELRSRLDSQGLLEQERIITYCGGAIAATITAFALALFGHEHLAVYDGSLMEWAADPDLPMTTAD